MVVAAFFLFLSFREICAPVGQCNYLSDLLELARWFPLQPLLIPSSLMVVALGIRGKKIKVNNKVQWNFF
jgi:hypothetical protein